MKKLFLCILLVFLFLQLVGCAVWCPFTGCDRVFRLHDNSFLTDKDIAIIVPAWQSGLYISQVDGKNIERIENSRLASTSWPFYYNKLAILPGSHLIRVHFYAIQNNMYSTTNYFSGPFNLTLEAKAGKTYIIKKSITGNSVNVWIEEDNRADK